MSDRLPLRVELAGFNVDKDVLAGLIHAVYDSEQTPPPREAITPETLSAAYARISRNPAAVSELRKQARTEVARARKSNEKIIFGLGHASVAEHAVFNFDVTGISRLAVEAVEHHRLASFTEKSQRYIRLDGDFVLPPEVEDAGLEQQFRELIEHQNDTYKKLYPKLETYFRLSENGSETVAPASSRAAEDARYVVSIATCAQFGMTANARTVENMVRRASAHPLEEVRLFGRELFGVVEQLAPSLVKYVNSTSCEAHQAENTAWWQDSKGDEESRAEKPVWLIHADEDCEERVIAALMMRKNGSDYASAFERAAAMTNEEKQTFIKRILEQNKAWNPAPREFEFCSFMFEITLSSTAFAQLKRHRMATQLRGPYNPALGWTVPDSIREVEETDMFEEVMRHSCEVARKIAEHYPAAAPYALTNAHRRRVLFQANAREMLHLSRLREDIHAQWDIRRIAGGMVKLVREKAPALMLTACGKHEFLEHYRRVYNANAEKTETAGESV